MDGQGEEVMKSGTAILDRVRSFPSVSEERAAPWIQPLHCVCQGVTLEKKKEEEMMEGGITAIVKRRQKRGGATDQKRSKKPLVAQTSNLLLKGGRKHRTNTERRVKAANQTVKETQIERRHRKPFEACCFVAS